MPVCSHSVWQSDERRPSELPRVILTRAVLADTVVAAVLADVPTVTVVVGQPTPWCLQHQFVLSSDHLFLAAVHRSSHVLSLAKQPFRDGSTGEVEVAAVEVVICLVEIDVVAVEFVVVAAVSLELVVLAALGTAGLVVVLMLRGPGPQLACPASQQCCRTPDGQEPILSQYAQQPPCTLVLYSAVSFRACWRCREPSGQKS